MQTITDLVKVLEEAQALDQAGLTRLLTAPERYRSIMRPTGFEKGMSAMKSTFGVNRIQQLLPEVAFTVG